MECIVYSTYIESSISIMVPLSPYLYVDIPEKQANDPALDQPICESLAADTVINVTELFSLRFVSTISFGSYSGEMGPDSSVLFS